MITGTLADFDLDLHLHSRYSISCSKKMGLESLAEHAPVKGLDGLGTGDCLHAEWLGELEDKLEESGGRYTFGGTSFILQSEVETLVGGRVHHLLLFPNFQAVHDMREYLHSRGARQIDRTGRPQIRISGGELLRASIDIGALCGPAHAFTPYVGTYARHCSVNDYYGCSPPFLELGLSADTGLAARINELSGIPFLTASDAHSPQTHRIGREFTRFRIKKSAFEEVAMAIYGKDGRGITLNVGLDVREGKYHRTGCIKNKHFVDIDSEIRKISSENGFQGDNGYGDAMQRLGKTRCPKCGSKIKIGVRERIAVLSGQTSGNGDIGRRPPYVRVLPLAEVIAGLLGVASINSKKVQGAYSELISDFGPEKRILLDTPIERIANSGGRHAPKLLRWRLSRLLADARGGNMEFADEGHSGIYGKLDFNKYITLMPS